MREMKHSKKLAFAVLAAVTAVGANVNPVDAASVVMDNTNVVTGANNAVVSAYEVSFEQAESIETNNGRMRYAFIGLSERDATLKKLNLYKKALPDLRFGSGSATAYINNGTMKVD